MKLAFIIISGLIAAPAATSPALAGGILVPGAGPQAQARAGAFVAKADDPSTLAHNPAGFAKMDGTHLLLGANFISMDLRFRRAGRYESTGAMGPDYEGSDYPVIEDESVPSFGIGEFQAVPSIAISTDFGKPEWPVRFGFGLFAPQGYPSRTFPLEVQVPGATDPAPAPQRYDIIRQEARTILPSVVVAYSPLENLDIAARFSWGLATTKGQKAVWSVRNYEEDPGSDSIFTLDADDNFVPAFGVGALYRPTRAIELGANWKAPMHIRSKGVGSSMVSGGGIEGLMTVPVDDQYAQCEPGGEIGALSACLSIDIPMMATVGGRYIIRDRAGRERADIELDVRWENWSSASNTTITVDGQVDTGGGLLPLNSSLNKHGFQDVFSIRLGGSYAVAAGPVRVIGRAGVAHDTATAPDSWLRVDIDGKARTVLAAGVAVETERFRVDVGGGVGLEADATIEQCLPPDGPSVENPGCGPDGSEIPFADRERPDPGQPLRGTQNQLESPFNAGTIESGYLLFSLGVTTWF